ncbi:MAG: hypothetical protein M1840_002374 [Geoglossum simile]|nr:MAG: hypothetical protein M1840_002374 [Geoglossum simile]
MSGVEGIVALSIAGNVVQFVSFGLRLCSCIREYSTTAGAPQRLVGQADCISDILETLKDLSETQKEVLEPKLVSRCISKAQELSALFDMFIDKDRVAKPSWRHATKAWRSLRAESKALELQGALESLLKPLDIRLQAKTAGSSKRTEDHTLAIKHQNEQILAKISSSNRSTKAFTEAIAIIPTARNLNFVGREELLSKLDEELSTKPNYQSKVSLCGLGGVGKSQAALEYAYRWLEQWPARSVFWVHSANTERFEESYKRIASECGIPRQQDPKEDMLQNVRNWLESKYKCMWLMIVDNVDDIHTFFKKNSFGKSLAEYLPQCSGGSIIFTTRDRRVGVNLVPGRDPIAVHPMGVTEAQLLLNKNIRQKSTEGEQKELLEELDYLPLAISQAAAFMIERQQTVSQYLTRYRKSVSARANLLKHKFTDHGREARPMESVATTFMISFDYIRNESPRASALLSLFSFLDRQEIPKTLIVGDNEDPLDFDDAIGTLHAFSLISTNSQFDMYGVHRLVHLATRAWLLEYDESRGRSWASQPLELLSTRFPHGNYKSWVTCAAYLPHAEAVLGEELTGTAENDLRARATLLLNTSHYYLKSQGRFDVAEGRVGESLQLRQNMLGERHPDTLASANSLALVLTEQGKYEAAEETYRRVLEGRKKVLGEEHPDTLASVNNLALVLSEQGKYEKAEEMNRQALEGKKKVLGEEHPDTLSSVSNLAFVLTKQAKYEAAEEKNKQALEGKKKILGEEHPSTLTSFYNLALVLKKQGKYEAAVVMTRRALEGREKALGEEHPDTFMSVFSLAHLLYLQKRWDEAIPLYRTACEGYKKVLGSAHPSTQTCVRGYSSVVREMQAEGLDVSTAVSPPSPT